MDRVWQVRDDEATVGVEHDPAGAIRAADEAPGRTAVLASPDVGGRRVRGRRAGADSAAQVHLIRAQAAVRAGHPDVRRRLNRWRPPEQPTRHRPASRLPEPECPPAPAGNMPASCRLRPRATCHRPRQPGLPDRHPDGRVRRDHRRLPDPRRPAVPGRDRDRAVGAGRPGRPGRARRRAERPGHGRGHPHPPRPRRRHRRHRPDVPRGRGRRARARRPPPGRPVPADGQRAPRLRRRPGRPVRRAAPTPPSASARSSAPASSTSAAAGGWRATTPPATPAITSA